MSASPAYGGPGGVAASPAASDGLRPGQLAGRYVLTRKIGEGGMGVVFEAFDPELDRPVAVKFFHDPDPRDTSQSRDAARQRLLSEARAMACVDHPNVVTVFDVGVSHERVFVAMELVRGKDLSAWIDEHRPSLERRLAVLIAAGRGLAAVHANGLVHRDFKPDNVLVSDDAESVFVLDFGLARRRSGNVAHDDSPVRVEVGHDSPSEVDPESEADDAFDDRTIVHAVTMTESASSRTRSFSTQAEAEISGVVGTPSYMSPEQHAGAEVDWRSDLYAFCITAYEAIYGRRPFDAKGLAALARLKAEPPDTPPPIAGVPPHLFRTIVAGLAPRPRDRPSDLAGLLDALAEDHAASRMRALWWLLILVLASVLALMVARNLSNADSACQARKSEERVARVWNPELIANIQNAFAATELGYAPDTFAGIRRTLDARMAGWTAAFHELCPAMQSTKGPRSADVQMSCLDRRLEETSDLVELLRHPDRTLVDESHDLVNGLSPIDDCLDPERLATLEPIPADPKLRQRVSRVRRSLARYNIRRRSAAYHDDESSLRDLLEQARDVGFQPLEAEAHEQLGMLLSDRGQAEASQEHLQRALEIAEATRHDSLAARVLSSWLFVEIYQRRRVDQARELIRHAETHVQRVPELPEIEADFLHSVGPALGTLGDDEGAEAAMRRAVELSIDVHGTTHPVIARAMQNHGVSLAMLGRTDESFSRLLQSIEIETNALGPHSPGMRLPLSNLSLMKMIDGDFSRAVHFATRALNIHRRANIPADDSAVRAVRNLGSALAELGRMREAAVHLETLIDLQRELHGRDAPRIIDAWRELALVQLELDDRAALRRSRQALTRLRRRAIELRGPDHLRDASARILAVIAHRLGDPTSRDRHLAELGGPRRTRRNAGDILVPRYANLEIDSEALRQGPAAAVAHADHVLSRFRNEHGPPTAALYGTYLRKARYALARGEFDMARSSVEAALRSTEGVLRPDNPRLFEAYAIAATTARRLGLPDVREQLRRAESSCDPERVSVAPRDDLDVHCAH